MPRKLIPYDDYLRTKIRSRGYLPHWEIDGATYSLTYRLHDSLPLDVLQRPRNEREAMTRQLTGGLRQPTAIERFDIEEAFALASTTNCMSSAGNVICGIPGWRTRSSRTFIISKELDTRFF